MRERNRGLAKHPYPNIVEVDHEALAAEAASIKLPGEEGYATQQSAELPSTPTTREFLRDLREHFGVDSDYALAKKLDVTQKTVKTWRAGRGGFSDAMAMRVEDELGLPRGFVVAAMHAERSIGVEAIYQMWARLAGLARGATPGIALAALGALAGGLPAPSQAAPGATGGPVIHYANWRRRRGWRPPWRRRRRLGNVIHASA